MRALKIGVVALIILFISACSAGTRETGGSPALHRVAKGAVIEVDVPFHGNSSVRFRNGEILGWFSGNTWAIQCNLNFKGNPGKEVSMGRYQVTRTRQQEISLGSSDYSLVTTLLLKTLKGPSADSMQCRQTGSYSDVGRAHQIAPVTVQQFKRAVGQYLTLTLQEESQ